LTSTAERQVRDLRGRRRTSAGVALTELRAQGCAAAGYRLAGTTLDHVCSRHLYGADRMLTAWPADDEVIVLAIARHDSTAEDVYATLLAALDLTVPEEERKKPPCCDAEGNPPTDEAIAIEIADAVTRYTRPRRRGR
jgi:hypothetical protein